MKKSQLDPASHKTIYFYGNKTVDKQVGGKTVQVVRRVALAGVVNEDQTINVGLAMCSEKDNFVKSKARVIATGRAIKKPYEMIRIPDGQKAGQVFNGYCATQVDPKEVK